MNRVVSYGVVFLTLIVVGFFVLNGYIYNEKQGAVADDVKNAEYVIDGKRVTLKDGVSEIEAVPGSASKTTTRYFGNELKYDLNDDGKEDVVFFLTEESGGSGVFYYVVAALNTERGYIGSEGLFLGDRIAPQTIERGKGRIAIVNYADRAPGESFSTPPSVGKSLWLLFDAESMQFGEVVQDFEGEADPSRMTLTMKSWTWISSLYNDGTEVRPRGEKPFTVTFGQDGMFAVTTDCNMVGGSYTTGAGTVTFENIFATKMYCEGSQEGDFTTMLSTVSGYHFTSRGELILDLKFDSGSVTFR